MGRRFGNRDANWQARATTRAHETCRTFLDGTSYVETSTKLHLAYLCKHFAVAYWFLINVFHHCFVDKFFVHEKIKKRICRLQTFNGWAMCWWKEIFLHVQFHTIRHYLATKTYPLVDMPGINEQPDYDGGEPNCRVWSVIDSEGQCERFPLYFV